MSDCTGGTIPSLQVINNDCTCVSISSITWNDAGTQFTITLNNGQSITSPVLEGAEGATPVIVFRVSGTTLQYNVDGGAWINLYDLSLLIGSKVLHNNGATTYTTVTNALELLTSFNMAAGQMAADGDILHVRARFRATPDNILKSAYIYLDGAAVASWALWTGSTQSSVELDVYISRTAAATGVGEYIVNYGVSDPTSSLTLTNRIIADMAAVAVSAWSAALTVAIYANDNAGNAITCDLFQATYIKKQ